MPRAASSTLYALIDELSERNKFTSEKMSSGELGSNSPANNDQIIEFLKGKPLDKYFLTKTHFWLDFDGFNISKPSYINLIRDPVTWFESRYNFVRRPAATQTARNKREGQTRSISKCVLEGFDECSTRSKAPWLNYLCGTSQTCKDLKSMNPQRRKKALEFTKTNVERNFLLVGLMEDFELSLKMFERALPRFFRGATKLLSTSERVQRAMKASHQQAVNGSSLSPAARTKLATVLDDEIAVYQFVKSLFYEKVKAANINI